LYRLNSRNGANSSLDNLNKDSNLAAMDTISEELNEGIIEFFNVID
jgi:hypothetical protein